MSNRQSCIVTITDGISPTSMPFNEFLLYRLNHYREEKQVLIQVFQHEIYGGVKIPDDVEFYSVGANLVLLGKITRNLEKKYNVVTYHIHEGKSVILFSTATFLRYRFKTVYTLHSTYRNYPLHNKLFSFCASLFAKKVVCVSKTSFKYYPKILKLLRRDHAMYIQNGVDIERIDNVADEETKPANFTMIYVARLVELKRHYILFEALRCLPDVKLQLVGIGPLEDELKRKAKSIGVIGQVVFEGLKPREDVYKMLKKTNLYVSSSSYEGLPVGVLEAMGCGAPCLVSDIEQHAEIKDVCPSLILCDDNIENWIKKISEIKNNPGDLGLENKRGVEQFFSLSAMHNNYDKLYYMNKKYVR